MSSRLNADKIFRPESFSEYTYISRIYEDTGFEYEIRLKLALSTLGCITTIVGPSKTGKTILCEKTVDKDKLIVISGKDCISTVSFWHMVGTKAELPSTSAVANTYSKPSTNTTLLNENYVLTKEAVIRYYVENNKVLLLDDFHYVSEDLQIFIVQQLKEAIRKDFKVIIIYSDLKADKAVRHNPGLKGRLSLIRVPAWRIDELEQIAIKGFQTLGISITKTTAQYIAHESLSSPQLMQQICLNICSIIDVDNITIKRLPGDIVKSENQFLLKIIERAKT